MGDDIIHAGYDPYVQFMNSVIPTLIQRDVDHANIVNADLLVSMPDKAVSSTSCPTRQKASRETTEHST
eukprot:1465258-Amphidinium_carterae.1